MSDPTDELPRLVDPETIGKMAVAWARDHAHSQSATLEIVLRGGRYEVRMREDAWGMRDVAQRPTAVAVAVAGAEETKA